MTTIPRGANQHVTRLLFQADGTTPLLRAAIATLQVELWSGNRLRATYVYNTDSQIFPGTGDEIGNAVGLEITTDFSSSLPSGRLTEIWQFSLTDAAYIGGARVIRMSVSDILIV